MILRTLTLGLLMTSCTKNPDTKEHEPFIRQSIAVAASARKNGNHPFGSLLVIDGKVVLTAENSVVTRKDTTNHAELNLVSKASQAFTKEELARSTLYTSTEPCAMCAGAIFWSGIPKVVFACEETALKDQFAPGSPLLLLPSRRVFNHGSRNIDVIGPVLSDEGIKVHEGFWK